MPISENIKAGSPRTLSQIKKSPRTSSRPGSPSSSRPSSASGRPRSAVGRQSLQSIEKDSSQVSLLLQTHFFGSLVMLTGM